MRYARIHYQAAESPDIGEALEVNPLAVSLFFLSIARADLYGILPGEPRRYRATVAPAANIPPDVVAEAIAEQERRGWVHCYRSATGVQLLYIVNYHEYQEVRWQNRVAPPEHELPACWTPPEGFLLWLVSEHCISSRKHGEQWTVLRERYGSATVALQERYSTQDTRHKTQYTEHRTDTAGRAREDEPEPTARPTEPEPMASVPEPVAPATPTPPDPATEHDPSTMPPDLHMQKLNHGTLSAAVRKALSGRTQAKRSDQWFADLLAFTRDYPDRYSEAAIVEALSRDPPKAADKFADRWLERVMPRASPPDPALSPIQAEIAKYGRALTATERADLKDREARARAG